MKNTYWPLLLLVIVMIYSPLLQFGYVQDDHGLIASFQGRSTVDVLTSTMDPAGKLFYRPLGELYCYVLWSFIGENAWGFHLASMLWLLAASVLVVKLARELTHHPWIEIGAGLLYASSATTHLDAQMWMVGVYDNAFVVFALACALFLLRRRYFHAVGMVGWALGFKGLSASLWALPPGHPYAAAIGWNIPANVWQYLQWLVAPLPFLGIVGLAFACAVVYVKKRKLFWWLVAWMIVALLSASILVNRAYHYYAMLALPAACIMISTAAVLIAKKNGNMKFWWIVLLLVNVVVSMWFVHGHALRGANDDIPAVNDGYNHLIRKAARGM